MGKSQAKKQREKWQREGFRNPNLNRGSWGTLNPVTKKTATRIEKLRKLESKHKKRFDHGSTDNGQIVFYCSDSGIMVL